MGFIHTAHRNSRVMNDPRHCVLGLAKLTVLHVQSVACKAVHLAGRALHTTHWVIHDPVCRGSCTCHRHMPLLVKILTTCRCWSRYSLHAAAGQDTHYMPLLVKILTTSRYSLHATAGQDTHYMPLGRSLLSIRNSLGKVKSAENRDLHTRGGGGRKGHLKYHSTCCSFHEVGEIMN